MLIAGHQQSTSILVVIDITAFSTARSGPLPGPIAQTQGKG
jgi:hypothetical protein